MMLFAMMFTVSSAMTDVVSFNNESTTPTYEDIRPPVCSGVLECGKIIPNETEKHDHKFLGTLFFQVIFVYCSCIYYRRIIDGLEFLRDNIDVIFNIFWNIFKCIIYFFLLMLTIGVVFSAIGDKEREMTLLKVMSFVSFLDYIDERENREEEEVDEEEEYRRWRRRRGD